MGRKAASPTTADPPTKHPGTLIVGLVHLFSRGQMGMEAYRTLVEVHVAGGLPSFTIAGLPAAAVRESRDRVRAALQTCGHPIPASRVTVHLGPADIPKEGGRFDLPIALGVLQVENKWKWPVNEYEFIGELGLSGAMRPVLGVLPAVLAARDAGRAMILPAGNAVEAALVKDARVYPATHLMEVVRHLNGDAPLKALKPSAPKPPQPFGVDLSEVRGHGEGKRALLIAAAGAHHLLMLGPPGSGKSMLAQRLITLLPRLAADDMLCAASIASVAGAPLAPILRAERPFRNPHHTATVAALVGGGTRPKPGEISLAHLGVLFLDELPEFSRGALEALREPLENGTVSIARSNHRVRYPCEFQLVAAMNPCPCGYLGDGTERCRCSESRLDRYRSRLSGPILDRFDIQVEIPRIPFDKLVQPLGEGESAALARKASAALQRQLQRSGAPNARLTNRQLWRTAALSPQARRVLMKAADRWQLSNRTVTRILKVARTVADLADAEALTPEHVAEAIHLRCLDRLL